MSEQHFVPEGEWEEYGDFGAVRYLRSKGEGGLEVYLAGMKQGATVRVLPDGMNSGRRRRASVYLALHHAEQTPRLRRLNADDKAMWLIGFLWSKDLRMVEYHLDLAHRA